MRALLFILSTLLLAPHPTRGEERAAAPWLEGLCLVVLDSDDVASLHAAHAHIRARGGSIAILSPPNLLLGWIPPEAAASLLGQAHIRAIHRDVVDPATLSLGDPQSRAMVASFNAARRGTLLPPSQQSKPSAWPAGSADAVPRPPLDPSAYRENLRANGFDLEQLAQRNLLLGKTTPDVTIQGNSDRMTGTVAVTLIFVESDGSGADPNSYTWTDADVQSYIDGVNAGLAWWSARARDYNDCWVAFFVRYMPPTDPRCQQWREMVLHPSSDVGAMASEIMSNFGYNAGGSLARTDAFNTAQRALYGTNWAYTAYVAYNPLPAPDRLTNGTSAFAYLTGPYTFLLFRSYGWQPAQVFPHESGHIFGACDEYAGGCTCGAICIDEPNGNCEDCGGGLSCMMRANSFTLCSYTDNQLGWHDTTPCAPPPLVPPTAISIQPSTAVQGTQLQATITGQDFLYGAFAEMGSGVQIVASNLLDANTLQLTLQIDNTATPGTRNVTVKNRDLQSSTLPAAFAVTASTRHYYDSGGSNEFPYITPATAATSLTAAMNAAGPGDSVLVASGTLPLGSFSLTKAVLLSGAWVDGFTSRDLEQGKTVFNLTGNVYIAISGGGTGGFDGFVFRGGRGITGNTPLTGHYGGGIYIASSTAWISHCVIDSNQATVVADFGGGGGIFANNSTVTLRDNTFRKNRATRGGGLYLYDSSGLVENNHFFDNEVVASTQTPRGAAIVLDQCDGVSLVDNVVEQNSGAEMGGGLYVVGSTQVDVQGGSFSRHHVTNSGGGARLESSDVALRDVVFERNASDTSEGGLAAASACSLEVDGCRFLWNTAVLHGGMHSAGPHAAVRHSLFLGNTVLFASALALDNVSTGEVLGNTCDRNAASADGGCLRLANSPVEVSNNIVSNTVGTGILCSGTLPALLDYNLVWNSSVADYSGCAPGAASSTGEPLFADTSQVDYHLAVHSPAIDAGRTEPAYADPDGSRGDLGWFGSHDFTMQQPVFPQNLSVVAEAGHVILSWSSNPEPGVTQYAVYCDSTSGFKPGLESFVGFVAAPDTTVDLGPPGFCRAYTLAAVNAAGYASGYAAEVLFDPTDALDPPRAARFRLLPSAPNPFNPLTTIRFELDRSGPVRLGVYDLAGRLVRVLVQEVRGSGAHGVVWDGRDQRGRPVPSGVYLLRLQSAGRLQSGKVTVLK